MATNIKRMSVDVLRDLWGFEHGISAETWNGTCDEIARLRAMLSWVFQNNKRGLPDDLYKLIGDVPYESFSDLFREAEGALGRVR